MSDSDRDDTHRRALLALLIIVPAPSIGAYVAFHGAPGAVGNAVYTIGKAILYGMPLIWLRLVDRRPFGLSPMRRGGLGFGVLSGLAVGAVIWAAYLVLPGGTIDPAPLRAAAAESGFATPTSYLALAAGLSLVNALLEEYVFRWFIYGKCRILLPAREAAILGAAIFTAHHVIVLRTFFDWPLTLTASAGVFVGGLIWTWCYERYGSIWPGYVSHVLVDVAVLTIGWTLLF